MVGALPPACVEAALTSAAIADGVVADEAAAEAIERSLAVMVGELRA